MVARGTHRRGNHTPQFGRHLPQEAATWDSIGENSPHTVTERLSYCRPLLWGAPGESFFLFFACSVCRFFRSCAWLYASDSPSLLEEGDTGICFQTMGMKGHDMLIMARWFYAYICWTHERGNLDRVLEIAWKLSAGDSGFSQPLGWWFGNCEWKLCEVGNKEKEWLQKETWRHTFLLAFQSLGIVYGRLRTAPL